MDYDVIIVGGRPAGASLAARLGARGLRVLVVDRMTFPSLPAVPSSPVLYPCAMRLLEALGIPEAGYADPSAQMRRLKMELAGLFTVEMTVPAMQGGRDYVRGIERTTFDELLWRNLDRFPSVTRREGYAVRDLLRDGDRVIGIVGGEREGAPEEITARAVVGADGRFSLVARKVGAEAVIERNQHTSTAYYADWAGVESIHPEHPAAFIHASARGLDVILFAMPRGLISVNTHARSDRVDLGGDAERYYHETVRSIPSIARHLARAERVSPIYGVKRIGNGYRRASGPGWALCGDAVHFKDPVDGQGIYDALLGTEILDRALASTLAGDTPWATAMDGYWRELLAATHPMFVATTGRLERELYQEPPIPVIKTLLRWTLSDHGYQENFFRVLSREVPPEELTSKRVMARAVARGIGRDLRGLLRRG
ncbi:MAG: NAD(P)/FAD-dependent oxidoreductase [Nannocystaceae bacterium]